MPPKFLKSEKVEDERVFDPIESKESWSKLLGKRVVPRCEHNEPCISLVTKKPGVNCGKHPASFMSLQHSPYSYREREASHSFIHSVHAS